MVIRGALETLDRQWRVEVVQQGSRHGYRILHAGEVLHAFVGVSEVSYYLRREGVNMADLVDVAKQSGGAAREAETGHPASF